MEANEPEKQIRIPKPKPRPRPPADLEITPGEIDREDVISKLDQALDEGIITYDEADDILMLVDLIQLTDPDGTWSFN